MLRASKGHGLPVPPSAILAVFQVPMVPRIFCHGGSIGNCSYPGRVKKRWLAIGNERIATQNLWSSKSALRKI
jgi:hypothetical protein